MLKNENVQWELLTPTEFKKIAKEEGVCILPIGSLERHGDCFPFGVDMLIAHTVAVEAAKLEKCVVFPPYYFACIGETDCFQGTISLSRDTLLKVLEEVVSEIARNGFKKILLCNSHGGNTNMLYFFAQTLASKNVDYNVYVLPSLAYGFNEEEQKEVDAIIEGTAFDKKHGDHAGEWEGSLIYAIAPESVKMEQNTHKEFIAPTNATANLGNRLFNAYGWFGNYPDNAQAYPYLASKEKGERLLKVYAKKLAGEIRIIKEDKSVDKVKKHFFDIKESIGK